MSFKILEFVITALNIFLKIIVLYFLYINNESDNFFFQIAFLSLVNLLRFGLFTYFIELKNNKNKIEKNTLFFNLLYDVNIIFLLSFFLDLIIEDVFLISVVISIIRLIIEYSNVFFTLISKSIHHKLSSLFFESLCLISIFLFSEIKFIISDFVLIVSLSLSIIFINVIIYRLKKVKYLIIDALSTITFNYDIIFIQLLNPINGFISDYSLITRIINISNKIGNQLTETYRNNSSNIKLFIFWNKRVRDFSVLIILILLIISFISVYFLEINYNITFFQISLISIFFILQCFSRYFKNNVVRVGLIKVTYEMSIIFSFIFFISLLPIIYFNSISFFFLNKILLSSLYIYGYNYLLRYRSRIENS